MQDFRISGKEMNRLTEELKTIQENMESSYNRIASLVQRVEGDGKWSGEQQKKFLAYIKLMEEYHKCFTNNNAENPLQQAIDGLKELEEHVEAFYMDFTEYKKVEGLR